MSTGLSLHLMIEMVIVEAGTSVVHLRKSIMGKVNEGVRTSMSQDPDLSGALEKVGNNAVKGVWVGQSEYL